MKEKEAIKNLLEKFEQLINAKEETKEEAKKEIAFQIDHFCTWKLNEDKDFEKWNAEFQEIISGCFDLHHWGNERFPPTYTEENIKKLAIKLKKMLEK